MTETDDRDFFLPDESSESHKPWSRKKAFKHLKRKKKPRRSSPGRPRPSR